MSIVGFILRQAGLAGAAALGERAVGAAGRMIPGVGAAV